MFVPGQFGTFPGEHSRSGSCPSLGSGLSDVAAYDDLFVHRQPAHLWLLDSRARDALNTHDLRVQGGYPALAHKTIMGCPADQHRQRQTTNWYIQAYLHADDPAILPLGEDVLTGLQLGGKRNYGYGEVTLQDTQLVSLNELDYSRLDGAETYLLEVVTPFVLQSEYPGASDCPVPW